MRQVGQSNTPVTRITPMPHVLRIWVSDRSNEVDISSRRDNGNPFGMSTHIRGLWMV